MGNNNHEPYEVNRFIEAPSSTVTSNNHQKRQQSTRTVGLRPTDANQDSVYKRSANGRASKRSHNERRSYLMATGHLDRDEAVCLTSSLIDNTKQPDQQNNIQYSQPSRSHNNLQSLTANSNQQHSGQKQYVGDQIQPFNQYHHLNYSADQFDTIENPNLNNIFSSHNNIIDNNNNNSKRFKSPDNTGGSSSSNRNHRSSNRNSKRNNNHSSSGNFERSYTEVTLPMKTSPAFEYLLQNDKRKYKKVILWVTYLCLISTCIAIIYFYSTKLMERINHMY